MNNEKWDDELFADIYTILIDIEESEQIEELVREKVKQATKEMFGELIKSTALCEPQGGHCSLDYLIVKARQHGLEYTGLDKDGNVIWVGDTVTADND